MKILILNLTRFGDLLQTSPTIVGLRATHPDAHVTVCVDRNFAEVCRGLPGVDRVWEIELDRLGKLLLEPGTGGLRAAYHTVEELVAALRAERFELGLNYSSSRMSAVLMGLQSTTHWVDAGIPRRLVLPVSQVGTQASVTLPADPNLLPLGWYMLFGMVDDIPSVGRILRVDP